MSADLLVLVHSLNRVGLISDAVSLISERVKAWEQMLTHQIFCFVLLGQNILTCSPS